jgi:hypothetical protein
MYGALIIIVRSNNPIKDQWPEPSQGRQKGKAKGKPKDAQPLGTKKRRGRELVPLMGGSYLTHSPSNVTIVQIVRFNNNEMFRTSITYQCNLSLYSKG